MIHLLISREYPPATYPRGGIGTYVEHIARLLVERGETVHVIAELWDGAPEPRQVGHDGRLIIHRVPQGQPIAAAARAARPGAGPDDEAAATLDAMGRSAFPAQSFAWQAGLLAEHLIDTAAIDVIEGQEYEAPLYYFLLRRALGLGPARHPPCVVHLHSPWEFVCHYNGWGLATDYDVTIKRFEDYAITAADAALCPSRYLASQAESHYGLAPGSVERLAYPIGDTPFIERAPEVWSDGAICYVGRLEPRKGVLEWVEAAAQIAATRPGLRFEFIGADTSLTGARDSSTRAALEASVPPAVRPSFQFLDPLPRAELWQRLARARMVVVPSRWENFPLTCVEAMCSGLPVLASPHGGMAEMIEDARTGWIAQSGSPAHLAEALARALGVTPEDHAAMGRAAATAIRRICDNDAILDWHLAFKQQIVNGGATRSLQVPVLPPWRSPSDALRPRQDQSAETPSPARVSANAPADTGIALVVIDDPSRRDAMRVACLDSIAAQTRPPAAVIIVSVGAIDPASQERTARLAREASCRVTVLSSHSVDEARAAGITSARESGPPLGIAFISTDDRLEPSFVESAATALARLPNVGVLSCWSRDQADGRIVISPHPDLPYVLLSDEIDPCAVFRTKALLDPEWVEERRTAWPESAIITRAVLIRGWQAITYPEVLVSRRSTPPGAATTARDHLPTWGGDTAEAGGRLEGAGRLLDHLLAARAPAPDLRQLGRGALAPGTVLQLPVEEQLKVAARALRNPAYAMRWLVRHGRRALARARARWSR